MSDNLASRRKKFAAAQKAWNADNGPIEKTVRAGEDLYFAAVFLVEALDERLTAAIELRDLAARLTPSGEIGDGMVARFHELAGRLA